MPVHQLLHQLVRAYLLKVSFSLGKNCDGVKCWVMAVSDPSWGIDENSSVSMPIELAEAFSGLFSQSDFICPVFPPRC